MELCAGGRTLLAGADLRARAGEKVGLRGASGCGKSSLLKSAVGLFPLAAGEVVVDGVSLSPATAGAVRARVAFVGQEPALGAETVRDALLLPFRFKAHRDRRPAERRLLETLDSLLLPASIMEKACARVSGGEKQRVAMARALLMGKTIFLVDEITSALDPESKRVAMEALFRPELTMLSVSHDPEWLARCDRVVSFEGGRLEEAEGGT